MSDVESLVTLVWRTRQQVDRQAGELRTHALAGKRLQGEISDLKRQIDLYTKASTVLLTIGEQRQVTAQEQIEALVTRGLQVIFGEDLSFHLVASTKGKQSVVDFVVRSHLGDQTVDTDVMSARGGGLAATVGFLLRLVVLLLSRKGKDSVLFLDESFAHVSAEYEPRLAEFLRELVDKTGVQVLVVTHSEAFNDVADRRYRFDLVNGQTKVREL